MEKDKKYKEYKSYNAKYEELTDVLVDITHSALTEQEINTLTYYPVYIGKENYIEIKIWKEEDKYRILQFGDKLKTIKRSDIEAIEILLNLNQILIQAIKIVKQMEQHNKKNLETN